MEVFALDLAVRETGAVQVERSLGKMRAEAERTAAATNRVAASATATRTPLSNMANGMRRSADISRVMTGNVLSSVDALAVAMGPAGVLAIATGAFVVYWKRAWDTIQEDTLKAQRAIIASTRQMFADMSKLAREANAESVTQALVNLSRGAAVVIGEEQLFALPEQERAAALAERGLLRLRTEYERIQQILSVIAKEERFGFGSLNRGEARLFNANKDRIKDIETIAAQYATAIGTLERTAAVGVARLSELGVAAADAMSAMKRAAQEGGKLGIAQGKLGGALSDILSLRARAESGGRGTTVLGRLQATAAGFSQEVQPLVNKLSQVFEDEQTWLSLRESMAMGLSMALVSGLEAGFQSAFSGGGIGGLFQGFTAMMLAGLGDAMIQFGTQSAAFAALQQKIMTGLASLNPAATLAGAVALIGLGTALKGAAGALFNGRAGGSRGTGSYGGTGMASGMGQESVSRVVFGPTTAGVAAGMTPRQFTSFTVIGPNDPTAQRAIEEILRKAERRGGLG